MNGVFIEEMNLPNHCCECPLALLDSYGYRNCFITGYNVSEEAYLLNERHYMCPMSEIEVGVKGDDL